MMVMVGTVLGPGTIFLMLVGAFNAAFSIANWDAFLYNLIPILLFMVVCFTLDSKIQLFMAQLMSAAYALIMMAVLVGIILQVTLNSVTFRLSSSKLPLDSRRWAYLTNNIIDLSCWRIFHFGCHCTSSRIWLSSIWNHLLHNHSSNVSTTSNLFHFQFECSILGNKRRSKDHDQEGGRKCQEKGRTHEERGFETEK